MNMHFVTLLAIAGLLLAAPARAAASASSARPNIILCMTDDQGWGDVGYNGNPILKTPNLDAMAASGVRFDRFYAAYPVCSPTRGSVLTGRNPSRYRRAQQETLNSSIRRPRTGNITPQQTS